MFIMYLFWVQIYMQWYMLLSYKFMFTWSIRALSDTLFEGMIVIMTNRTSRYLPKASRMLFAHMQLHCTIVIQSFSLTSRFLLKQAMISNPDDRTHYYDVKPRLNL